MKKLLCIIAAASLTTSTISAATSLMNYNRVLFIGDSQTYGLSFNKFVPSSRVAAKIGLSLDKAITYPDIINKVSSLKPQKIFMLFGHNDIYPSTEYTDFTAKYLKLVKKIRALSPKSRIYIESVTPVSESAQYRYPYTTNPKIYKCNAALENMADENKLTYLNIVSLVESKYLRSDGVHLKAEFYPVLLKYLSTK